MERGIEHLVCGGLCLLFASEDFHYYITLMVIPKAVMKKAKNKEENTHNTQHTDDTPQSIYFTNKNKQTNEQTERAKTRL